MGLFKVASGRFVIAVKKNDCAQVIEFALKAGDYTIGPASGITNQRALVLSNRSNGKVNVVGQAIIGSSEGEAKGTMTVAKDDDGWALRAIDTPGFVLNLEKTKSDETNVASANKAPENRTVTLQY